MDDDYLTLTQASKITPGRPHISSIWRWIRRGTLTRSRSRVHLRAVRAGGRIFTTRAWLDEYMTAVSEGDAAHFEAVAIRPSKAVIKAHLRSRTLAQRERAVAAAERDCQSMGT